RGDGQNGKAEKSCERHFEELPAFEARHRIDPLAPSPKVEELPDHSRPNPAGEQTPEAAAATLLEISQQGLAAFSIGEHFEADRSEPDERKSNARKRERQDERESSAGSHGGEDPAADLNRSAGGVSPGSEPIQKLGVEETRRQNRRERHGGHWRARPPISQSKDVVPVVQHEIAALEEKPERDGPEKHRRQPPALTEDKRASAERED